MTHTERAAKFSQKLVDWVSTVTQLDPEKGQLPNAEDWKRNAAKLVAADFAAVEKAALERAAKEMRAVIAALEAKHAAELAKTAQMLDWLRRVVRCEPVDAPVTCPRCSANVAGFSNVLHTAGGAGLCGACWSVRAVKAELDLAEARAVIAAREADIRRALGAADTAIAPWVRELLRGCPSAPAPAPIAPNPPSVVTSPELYGPRPRTREHYRPGEFVSSAPTPWSETFQPKTTDPCNLCHRPLGDRPWNVWTHQQCYPTPPADAKEPDDLEAWAEAACPDCGIPRGDHLVGPGSMALKCPPSTADAKGP